MLERIEKNALEPLRGGLIGVADERALRRLVELPHVVQPVNVVGVIVREKDHLDRRYAAAHRLQAEFGRRVHEDVLARIGLDDNRGPRALILRVGRGAHLAPAPYDGNTQRRTRA